MVAGDSKGGDKHRDDSLSETPSLEAKRLLISTATTRRRDGGRRQLLFIGARKSN